MQRYVRWPHTTVRLAERPEVLRVPNDQRRHEPAGPAPRTTVTALADGERRGQLMPRCSHPLQHSFVTRSPRRSARRPRVAESGDRFGGSVPRANGHRGARDRPPRRIRRRPPSRPLRRARSHNQPHARARGHRPERSGSVAPRRSRAPRGDGAGSMSIHCPCRRELPSMVEAHRVALDSRSRWMFETFPCRSSYALPLARRHLAVARRIIPAAAVSLAEVFVRQRSLVLLLFGSISLSIWGLETRYIARVR